MGVGIVGVETDGLAQFTDRLFQMAMGGQGDAEVDASRAASGLRRTAARNSANAASVWPCCMSANAEVAAGRRVVGIQTAPRGIRKRRALLPRGPQGVAEA